jgi:beta-N-acetylhexosaminidase
MKSLGFNLNLAPDLDLTLSDTSNIGKSERSFGVSADNAKKKGQEFISKMHTAGIGATGKHFPGYGDVAGDSDNQLVKVEGINNNEKIIFNDLKNNLDAIMMSNIIYSADDPQNPAVFSNTIIEMAGEGFDNGVIITDDLNAKSVAPQQNCENAKVNAVKAFEAGNDMILNLNGKCVNDMVDAIYAAAQGDEDMKSQIAKSVDRINSLKDKYS